MEHCNDCETWVLKERSAPLPLCPSEIQHGLCWQRTRDSSFGIRNLSTWRNQPRPIQFFLYLLFAAVYPKVTFLINMSMKVAVQLRHSVIGIPQLFYLCVPIIRILQGIQVPKAVQSEAFSFERQARAEDRYGVSTTKGDW